MGEQLSNSHHQQWYRMWTKLWEPVYCVSIQVPVIPVGFRGHFFICSWRVEGDPCAFASDVNRIAWVALWGDGEGTEWGGTGIIFPPSFLFSLVHKQLCKVPKDIDLIHNRCHWGRLGPGTPVTPLTDPLPTLTTLKEAAAPYLKQWARTPDNCSRSFLYSLSPNKALLEFFIWPLN